MRRAQAQEWLDPYVSLAAADYRANLEATAAGLHRLGSLSADLPSCDAWNPACWNSIGC